MFWQIVKFEIRYRLKRPATYIYFFLLLGITFLMVATPNASFSETGEQLNRNAPILINELMLVIMIFGSLICAAIMGVPIFRDYDHNFNEIMHSLPVRKQTYLWGRFLGSYIITALVFTGLILGLFLGFIMPWQETESLGPLQLSAYLDPFIIFILPNLFIFGSLFFITGSYFRSHTAIYAQGVILLVLFIAVGEWIDDISQNPLFSLVDPFGLETVSEVTKYWTTADKNSMPVSLSGLILYNRLIWMGLASVASLLFTWRFNLTKRNSFSFRFARKKHERAAKPLMNISIENINLELDWKAKLIQWWHLSGFYLKGIVRSIPFLIMILCAIGLLLLSRTGEGMLYGNSSLPVTYMLMDSLSGNFILFLIIIIVVYTGELIWKDISTHFSLILDSSPLSSARILLSKFSAMIIAEFMLLGVIILTGIAIQLFSGFYDIQLGIYFKFLLVNLLPYMVSITFLTFLVHTLVNNKFLGHGIVILYYISRGFYGKLGIYHILFKYGATHTESYSGMNGLQKFIGPALQMDLHWLLLGIVFIIVAILYLKRGTENQFAVRTRLFMNNWKQSKLKYAVYIFLLFFMLSGFTIYYNTNILNTYRTKKENREFKANYEKKYSKYSKYPQPRITDVNLNVDIYPNLYGVDIKGSYIMVNKTKEDIDTLHFRLDPDVDLKELNFSRETKLVDDSPEYGYYIHSFTNSLKPGDTLACNFILDYQEHGFSNWGRPKEILPNGTFFMNNLLPYLGYDESMILTDKKDREKAGLQEKLFESAELTDTSAYGNTYLSQNSDRINYEAIVSTSSDQIALTCGSLVKDWTEGERRFFHYKMEVPIWNFVPFLSARYAVMKDKFGDVELEIYYHPEHDYNLDKMMKAMKTTIAYCDTNFSPYQHSALRIVEFPRYSTYAQSFAGIIPFSEGIGFILDIDEKRDIDFPFEVTAHEVAHQWWGHHVCAADVKGKLLMVESLANYTALMVMEHEYGKANIGKYLKYEQDKYLTGRAMEKKKEVPLNLVDDQFYIGYQKGSLAFYALQDYIGEDMLNASLKNFIQQYSYKEAPYPTSVDLLEEIDNNVPDSLSYLVDDMFRSIILFSNRIDSCHFTSLEDGTYALNFNATIEKFRADSLGKQDQLTPSDWVDIGVYVDNTQGEDSLVYKTRIKVDSTKAEYALKLDFKPKKLGIDPLHLLIDRNPDDNIKILKEVSKN